MVKDIEMGSEISSIIKSAKNLPLNMVENAEVGGNTDDDNNETVKKLLFFKKLNVLIGYFTSLYSGKKWVFFNSFGYS